MNCKQKIAPLRSVRRHAGPRADSATTAVECADRRLHAFVWAAAHRRHRGAMLSYAAALCAGALGVGNQVLGQGFAELRPTWQEQSLSGKEFNVPVDDALAAEIDTLIPQLGVAGYKARDAATQRLVEIGPAAFGRLRRAYRESDEFEVHLRIEEIVREAYLTHHV